MGWVFFIADGSVTEMPGVEYCFMRKLQKVHRERNTTGSGRTNVIQVRPGNWIEGNGTGVAATAFAHDKVIGYSIPWRCKRIRNRWIVESCRRNPVEICT